MRYIFSRLVTWALLSGALAFSMLAQSATKQEKAVMASLNANLEKARPGLQILEVTASGIPNLYEAALNNGDVLYATADGKHIITGKILRLDNGRLVDVMEEKQKPMRAAAMKKLSLKDSINFAPAAGKTKSVIYVFTDADCGYCQKMHAHMAEYNELGIEVRYLAFPRAGAESVSARNLANTWCAEDQQNAMNKIKTRQNIPNISCNNPVLAQYNMGKKIGVTGTPAVIREDGEMIGGYLPPNQMAKALGL